MQSGAQGEGESVTGHDLKMARVGARIWGKQLAEAMGISPSRVSHIESCAVPSTRMRVRYLVALNALIAGRQ